jgi:hypothetical protein
MDYLDNPVSAEIQRLSASKLIIIQGLETTTLT